MYACLPTHNTVSIVDLDAEDADSSLVYSGNFGSDSSCVSSADFLTTYSISPDAKDGEELVANTQLVLASGSSLYVSNFRGVEPESTIPWHVSGDEKSDSDGEGLSHHVGGEEQGLHERAVAPEAPSESPIVNAQYICCRDPFPLASPMGEHVPAGAAGELVGYNSEGRNNVVWHPGKGLFAFSSGRSVILQWLHGKNQGSVTQERVGVHETEVSCLALSKDGRLLVSAAGSMPPSSKNRDCMCVWDVDARENLPLHFPQSFEGQSTGVQALAISDDSTLLVSVGVWNPRIADDVLLCVWDLRARNLLAYASVAEPVYSVCFASNSATFVTAGRSVQLWTPMNVASSGRKQASCNLAYHVLFDYSDNVPHPSQDEHGEEEDDRDMMSPSMAFTSLSASPGHLVFAATTSGEVYAFDVTHKMVVGNFSVSESEIDFLQVVMTPPASSSSLHRSLQPSTLYLVVGSSSGYLMYLKAVDEEVGMDSLAPQRGSLKGDSFVTETKMDLDGCIVAGAFHSEALVGIVGTAAGTVWFVDARQGRQVRLVCSHSAFVNQVTFTPDEQCILSCSSDGSVRLFDMRIRRQVMHYQIHNQICICMAVHPRLPLCVAGYSDGSIRFLGLDSQQLQGKLRVSSNPITCMAFIEQGSVLVVGTVEGRIWHVDTNKKSPLRSFEEHGGAHIECLSVDQDGQHWLATDSDSRMSVWKKDTIVASVDVSSQYLHPYVAPKSHAGFMAPTVAAFVPGAPTTIVASAPTLVSQAKLVFFNFTSHQWTRSIPVSHIPISVSVDPRGQSVVTGNQDGVVALYPLTMAVPGALSPRDVPSRVDSPVLNRQGRGGHSSSPRPRSAQSHLLFTHNDLVNSVAFSSSGRHVVSAGHSQFHFSSIPSTHRS